MNKLLRFAMTIMAAALGLSAFAAVPTPVVRWTMDALDADGRVPDATGGGNALELGPGATLKDARFFGAKVLDCDGTQGCWARSTKKLAVGSRTVSVWVSRDATLGPMDPAVNTIPYLFSGLSGCSVNMPGAGIGLRMMADNQMLADGAAPRDRSWMHLVWVLEIVSIEGEKAIVSHRVYRDGGEYRNVTGLELTAANIDQVSQNLVLGNLEVNGTRPMYGALRDFCVFDSALDAAQAKELYLNSLHSRPPRTVGFWRMEDTVEDASGEGPFLEVGSDIAFSENGISGKALDFVDSREAYCVVPNDIPPFTDLSVSMWIRPAKGMQSMSSEVNNTLPHVFTLQTGSKEYYRVCINEREDVGFRRFSVADMATVDDSSAAAYLTGNVYVEKDLWSHFAFVAKSEYDSSANEWYVEPKYYLNGELVTTGRRTTCNAFKAKGFYPEDLKLVLGNRGYPNNRAFWGQMDDVALIAGALTAEEVRQLYHGVPQIEAGQDLVTVQPTAQLHGELSVVHTGDEGRAVAAAQATWQLQSAPEGGEQARIENPADLKSRVTLPVEGDYVFRLVAVSGPVKVFDEVTVSRVSPTENVPPAITVAGSGNAYVGIPYSLTATVTDSDLGPGEVVVTWKRESGPEAVLFEPSVGTATRAIFYQPGQYVLKATANDGADTTVATLALTVAAATADLTDGLMSHIQFDSVDFKATVGEYNTPWSYYYDRKQIHLAPGVAGYGLQVVKPFESSFIMLKGGGGWTLQEQDANGATESSYIPTNPYRAFSCWLKYDANSDTNHAFHAVIFEQPYNLGLMYDRENGQDVFRMYQNNGGATGDGFDVYTLTEVDMATEWVHVYALFDRCNPYASNVSELWINGVKQTATQKYMGFGRPRNGYLELGGLKCGKGSAGFSNHWTDTDGNSLSRTFPGYIDEFRMYSRNLNEAEIKLLAQHPAPAINYPPAIDGEPGALELQANVASTLAALAADDGQPQGSALALEWVVVSGDASQLTFSARTAKSTTVTALKAGTYVLALKATDGARTTYSESIVFEAAKAGMMLLIK